MTATAPTASATLARIPAGPNVHPGAQPMPAEQAEAHLIRLERLLADLDQAATSLADASWGASGEAHTARYLPGDSRQTVIEWADRIRTKLAEVAVLGDVADCPF